MTTTSLPVWLPSIGIGLVCSDDFEAVTVPGFIGAPALRLLGDRSGAVLANDPDGTLTWFLAPGAAAGWDLPRVCRFVPGSPVTMPAPDVPCTWWLHWRIRPRGDCMTHATALHDALAEAVAIQLGPRPEGIGCIGDTTRSPRMRAHGEATGEAER